MGRTNEADAGQPDPWPALPLSEWRATRDTLHMWTQIVGKVKLALAPPQNHWWQVPLYLSARGLTTRGLRRRRDWSTTGGHRHAAPVSGRRDEHASLVRGRG